jgi:hypothetical protein
MSNRYKYNVVREFIGIDGDLITTSMMVAGDSLLDVVNTVNRDFDIDMKTIIEVRRMEPTL